MVLAGLKAILEHNVRLNLVADRHPKGIEGPLPRRDSVWLARATSLGRAPGGVCHTACHKTALPAGEYSDLPRRVGRLRRAH